ncbi:ABC transporter substrate-binding protein [Capillimicrobium parvum]|uniref:Leucine-, isoleucine-, valine-, threonine-, and alanine-binding protein n=1 Tax=Capillimicrobium parvum TaxID=2884022 RepID=A0A9E6XZ80_9ACTN|nr:ABC transporter substrate-binding protein [Capillimicrobium parvum]UGS36486.1 Leucine-, isoleucine-, valine-, threonine-, and alanine-binding protein [Capillimicrobium parvum]
MRRLLTLLVLLVALTAPAAAGAALPATDIHIGAAFSATGSGSTYGGQQADAARLAVDEVNASGALGPARLVLDVRDDGSSASRSTAAFQQLIDGGAVALLGPTLSTSALAADRVAQARGIPVVSVSNTGDGVLDIGDFIFRVALSERAVLPVTVAVSHRRLRYRRAAIVWARGDTYSRSARDVFRRSLRKLRGVRVVADRSFAQGSAAGHRTALRDVAQRRPDALFIAALAPDVIDLMTIARRTPALREVPFVGGDAFNTPGLMDQAGDVAEGAISGTAWIAGEDTPGNAAFVRTYRERLGYQPDQFAAQAYTGVKLLAAAIVRAGSADPRAIRRALAGLRDVDTVLGRFSFAADREPVYEPVIQQVRDYGFVKIGG